ncbi:MAG: archease [Thermoplasmata archaeon]|nr:archease [Thermoplasmata archaeon]
MVENRYETIDHTADIAIKAFGSSLSEAFENAAFGMFDIMSDASSISPSKEFEVELEAPDLEQLLVDWLSELLYLSDVEESLFCEFEVKIRGNKLKGKVRGEKIDLSRHGFNTEIKAVTYHMLEIDTQNNTIQVLFDI